MNVNPSILKILPSYQILYLILKFDLKLQEVIINKNITLHFKKKNPNTTTSSVR